MITADHAYDAAVTALKSNDAPTAIAYLLHARTAAPRDTQVAELLTQARTESGSVIHQPPPFPVATSDVGALLVVVNLVLCVIIARAALRRFLGVGIAVWLACFVAWAGRTFTVPTFAVVARADVVTHVADDATSLERFRTHVGDELVVERQLGEWLLVSTPDGERAYLAVRDVVSVKADGQR